MAPNDAKAGDLHLLLAADGPEARPVLESGLDGSLAGEGEAPGAELPRDDEHEFLSAPDEDPEALDRQGWGLIVPEGEAGDRLLAAVQPLSRLREAQQGREPPVYRVPARGCETMKDAVHWSHRVYGSQALADRAAYQLILGDLDEVPLAVQQVQATRGFVGRLAFTKPEGGPDLDGYEAYTAKVQRWDSRPSQKSEARLILHVVSDGTSAVRLGEQELVTPALRALRSAQERSGSRFRTSGVEASGLHEPPNPDAFLALGRTEGPAALFSLSHGLGSPKQGWSSLQTQRERQGAMSFSAELGAVTAADVAQGAFLPGGLWLMFACLSAGTPAVSPYFHRLDRLRKMGAFQTDLQPVLASLPKDQRPFVASLPQAALRNPDGPLGFLGHVDLAWTYSFQDSSRRSRADRFSDALATWAKARRAGQAAASLAREFARTNGELTAYLDELARTGAPPSLAPDAKRGRLWMQRNDLAGFVLLGDPAARLPLRPALAGEELRGSRLEAVERAIARVLVGEQDLPQVAADAGLEPAELERLVAAYREGGRGKIGCG